MGQSTLYESAYGISRVNLLQGDAELILVDTRHLVGSFFSLQLVKRCLTGGCSEKYADWCSEEDEQAISRVSLIWCTCIRVHCMVASDFDKHPCTYDIHPCWRCIHSCITHVCTEHLCHDFRPRSPTLTPSDHLLSSGSDRGLSSVRAAEFFASWEELPSGADAVDESVAFDAYNLFL